VLVETPVVNGSALGNLKVLLDAASSHDLSLTEAQCFEGGADATDTGSKAVSMPTVSATDRETDVRNDATGSKAEDDRTHVAFAPPTLATAMRKPGVGGEFPISANSWRFLRDCYKWTNEIRWAEKMDKRTISKRGVLFENLKPLAYEAR